MLPLSLSRGEGNLTTGYQALEQPDHERGAGKACPHRQAV